MSAVVITVVACMVVTGIFLIWDFAHRTKEEQIKSIKEWLVYACLKAEKEYGSKTGQIKLRYVYGLFVDKFSWIAKIISFEVFSGYVNESLVYMRNILESNKAVADIEELK